MNIDEWKGNRISVAFLFFAKFSKNGIATFAQWAYNKFQDEGLPRKERRKMTNKMTKTTVDGKVFEVWSDFIKKATFAKDENGDVKAIKTGGYLHNDLSIRKAIANTFNLKTFRK